MVNEGELPRLYVEGVSDLHTIRQLLARHEIELNEKSGPVIIHECKGKDGVLKSMETAPKAASNKSVGFVIDADDSLHRRWASIRDRLSRHDLNLPEAPPTEGFVGDSPALKSRVGVWIMPDNQTDDAGLEQLLRTLIDPADRLIEHAQGATTTALQLSNAMPARRRACKSELHCWLAWQEEPGLPFGAAVKTRYFASDSKPAQAFIAWFKRLYRLG